jgi:4-hydroxy-tetrahydrodipicolinate reductase
MSGAGLDHVRPALAIIGRGRMGRAVEELATAGGWPIRARLASADAPWGPDQLGGADVAIDFTTAHSVPSVVRACLAARCAIVVGTTGWYDALPALSAEVEAVGGAMLWAPNFSVGAAALRAAAVQAARVVRAAGGFEGHIIEAHHRAKRDAPSGTAQLLETAVADAFGAPIPITSVRAGHIPGDHDVMFDAPFEQVRLTHTVRDRRVFADGALLAAAWLAGRHGVFTMADVLAR